MKHYKCDECGYTMNESETEHPSHPPSHNMREVEDFGPQENVIEDDSCIVICSDCGEHSTVFYEVLECGEHEFIGTTCCSALPLKYLT